MLWITVSNCNSRIFHCYVDVTMCVKLGIHCRNLPLADFASNECTGWCFCWFCETLIGCAKTVLFYFHNLWRWDHSKTMVTIDRSILWFCNHWRRFLLWNFDNTCIYIAVTRASGAYRARIVGPLTISLGFSLAIILSVHGVMIAMLGAVCDPMIWLHITGRKWPLGIRLQ